MSVVINDGVTPTLQDLAQSFPKEFKKALMDLGQRYRRRMREEFRAGSPAGQTLAPLSPLTIQMRHRRLAKRAFDKVRVSRRDSLQGKRARRLLKKAREAAQVNFRKHLYEIESEMQGFGGKLPSLTEYKVEADNTLRVGWLGGVVKGSPKLISGYQPALKRTFTKDERHQFHQIFGKTLPVQSYSRPERVVPAVFKPDLANDGYLTIVKSIKGRLLAARAKAVAR